MAVKIGIGRFRSVTYPDCNTKAYQRQLATRLRAFADILDDPATEVGAPSDFIPDGPGITWWVFMASGLNDRHFEVWGAINRAASNDEFAPEASGGTGDEPPPIDGG